MTSKVLESIEQLLAMNALSAGYLIEPEPRNARHAEPFNETLESYRREAAIHSHLPKSTLRHRFALLLKSWAEALEPSLERKTLSV